MGWLPVTDKDKQTRYERSFLYQEATAPLGFLYKLVRIGLIHGGMAAVQPELPFKDLLKVFCRGNLATQPRGVAPPADPLNLQSDKPLVVEAQPDSPYSPGGATDQGPYSSTQLPSSSGRQGGSIASTEEETIELHDKDLESQFEEEKPAATASYNVAVPPRFKSRVKMTKTHIPQRPVKERLGKQMPELEEGEHEPPAAPRGQKSAWEEGLEVVCLTPGQPVAQVKIKEELSATPTRSYAEQAVDEDWQLRQETGRVASRDATTDSGSLHTSLEDLLEEWCKRQNFDHNTADLRTRMALLTSARAFAETVKLEGENAGATALVQQDINAQFMTREEARRNQDPFLLSLMGVLPFVDNDYAPEWRGPPIDRKQLDHDVLNQAERDQNPYEEIPRFHRRCLFCGANHCSPYLKGGQVTNCLKFRPHLWYSPTRQVCLYIRCPDRSKHHTLVCPYLHSRCSDCGCRGHTPLDRCDLRNPAIMGRLRADFEQAAPLGVYTHLRVKGQPEWGFYKFSRQATSGTNPPADYQQLTDMDVLDAMVTVEALNLAAELKGPGETSSSKADSNNNKTNKSSPPLKRRRTD